MGVEEQVGRPSIVVGLLGDPGLPAEIADRVAGQLPEVLAGHVSGDVQWRVEVASEELTLDEHGNLPMPRLGREQKSRQGWDLVVLITDLPRRAGTQPIVSDYDSSDGVALVSLPALGAVGLTRRALKVVVHLLVDHLMPTAVQVDRCEHQTLRVGGPVQHIESTHEDIDAHLGLVGARGRLRLLTGMVRSNRPWRLVPSLSPAIAGAAAGAAFGIFYSNIWQLADAFGAGRLVLVNVLAVLAMIAWLIIDNNLWERPSVRQLREEAVLYNAATGVTIAIGVLCMYVLLYVIALVSAFVVIPPDYLQSTLKHPSGGGDFAIVAWLSTSMGIVAGALGSGLASEEAVRQAAYSRREQQRRARLQDQGSNGPTTPG